MNRYLVLKEHDGNKIGTVISLTPEIGTKRLKMGLVRMIEDGDARHVDVKRSDDGGIDFYSRNNGKSVIKVTSDGVRGEDVSEIVNNINSLQANYMNQLDNTLEVFVDELTGKTTASQTSLTRRWFYMKQIPKGSKINTVKFNRPVAISNNSKVEVWEYDGTNYTLVKSIELTNKTTGVKTITINYVTQNPAVIAFNGDGCAIYTTTNTYTYIGPANDLTSTTYTPDKITKYMGSSSLILQIDLFDIANYVNVNIKKVRSNIITVGIGCDYSNLQDAIENCNDSAANPVTIRLMPKATPYARFSMVEKDGAEIPGFPKRYISIIGTDPYRCVVQDDTGNYHTPPAEVRTDGVIYGIGFIATHDNPTPDDCGSNHKSYAMHIDFGACDLKLEWCRFISYQAPGIGMGLAQDMKVKIKNCDIESYATADYGGLVNFGGLFVHSQDAADITGQILILDNCRVFSQNGDKAAWFSHMSSGTSSWKITSYNSMFYGATCGKVVSITKEADVAELPTITADSYGNNVTELNPAL